MSPVRNSKPGPKKARGSGGSSLGSNKRVAALPEKKAPFKPKKLLTVPVSGNVAVKKLKVQKFKSGGLGRKSQASQESLNRSGIRQTKSQQLATTLENRKVCSKIKLVKTMPAMPKVTSKVRMEKH